MDGQVLVSVTGRQYADGQTDEITNLVSGRLIEKNGARYLSYQEVSSDTGDVTNVTLKAEPHRVVMLRSGASKTSMTFLIGQDTFCEYDTGAGSFQFRIHTESMLVKFGNTEGRVSLCYTLFLNGEALSRNEVIVTVRPAEKQ